MPPTARRNHAFSSSAIWIDTLCVPVERKGRKLALRQLGKAYEEATHVLVLDTELQQKSMHCREEERLMRILLSGWMHKFSSFLSM